MEYISSAKKKKQTNLTFFLFQSSGFIFFLYVFDHAESFVQVLRWWMTLARLSDICTTEHSIPNNNNM